MGWAGGSELLIDTWNQIRKFVPEKKREKTLSKLISLFENHDCDTTYEIENLWPESNKALLFAGHELEEDE